MAAGDIHFKIEEIQLFPQRNVRVVYHFAVEDKNGRFDGRRTGDFTIPWDTFMSSISAGDRNALQNIRQFLKNYLVNLDPTNFAGSAEDIV